MPKKKTEPGGRIALRLDGQAYQKLQSEAARRYVQVNDLIRLAIGEFLQRLDAGKEN